MCARALTVVDGINVWFLQKRAVASNSTLASNQSLSLHFKDCHGISTVGGIFIRKLSKRLENKSIVKIRRSLEKKLKKKK